MEHLNDEKDEEDEHDNIISDHNVKLHMIKQLEEHMMKHEFEWLEDGVNKNAVIDFSLIGRYRRYNDSDES